MIMQATYFAGTLPIWGVVFQFMGAIIIAVCYAPGTFAVLRNKQTQDMTFVMWWITVFALTCLAIFAACGLAGSCINHAGVAQFVVVFCSETICDVFAILILVQKLINVEKAKSQGLTEREYCLNFAKAHPSKKAA